MTSVLDCFLYDSDPEREVESSPCTDPHSFLAPHGVGNELDIDGEGSFGVCHQLFLGMDKEPWRQRDLEKSVI